MAALESGVLSCKYAALCITGTVNRCSFLHAECWSIPVVYFYSDFLDAMILTDAKKLINQL